MFRKPITLFGLIAGLLWASAASATWSIILVDRETKEVAIGSATCVPNIDLQEGVAVVVPGIGAGAAQSVVDISGQNRGSMRNTLMLGWRPDEIIQRLDDIDSQFHNRQYGIVDHLGRPATFSGNNTGIYAGGTAGVVGTISYAIQGNLITGEPVITEAEAAVRDTPGDLAEKLMAGMEAARKMGGDGRCSCAIGSPTACGAPPDAFGKSAHVGFMIVSRAGDTLGPCSAQTGCAAGTYYMNLNIAGQEMPDPDPVFQLREQFDAWRATLDGRVDAIKSTATMKPAIIPSDASRSATLSFTLRDWADVLVDDPALTITVEHAEDSAGVMTIGVVQAIDESHYEVDLSGPIGWGTDRYEVRVVDGVRDVILMPLPQLTIADPVDGDNDGDIDLADTADVLPCLSGPATRVDPGCAAGDLNFNGYADLHDMAALQHTFTGLPCQVLYTFRPPEMPFFVFCEDPVASDFEFIADPPPHGIQWYLDGAPIEGATGTEIDIPAAWNEHRGFYHVEVTSDCGVEATAPVELRIIPIPCR